MGEESLTVMDHVVVFKHDVVRMKVIVVVVVVDCYCFLLNIIVEPLLSGPSHLASAKCMILSKPIVWPQPNDGAPGGVLCCCNLAGIHLGCKKSYVSADSSFYLNKLMFSFSEQK